MLTKNEINMARELTKKIQVQGDLIAKVLCNMTGSEWFECVEFLPSPTGEKGISITIRNDVFGMARTRAEWFPEEYLSKSEAELVYELNCRREEEKRQKEAEELAEKEAKEREEEEARKKRYQMFLELTKEFQGKEDKKARKMKEVYAIHKKGYDAQDDSEWPGLELFESEDDAIMVLSLEVGKHIYDQGFTWNGRELTWTSGNWSYEWWLEKILVVESGAIVSNLQKIGIEMKKNK